MTVQERINRIAAEAVRLGTYPARTPTWEADPVFGRYHSAAIWDMLGAHAEKKPRNAEPDEPIDPLNDEPYQDPDEDEEDDDTEGDEEIETDTDEPITTQRRGLYRGRFFGYSRA